MPGYLFPIISFQGAHAVFQKTQRYVDANYYRRHYRLLNQPFGKRFGQAFYQTLFAYEIIGKKGPEHLSLDFRICFHGHFSVFRILFDFTDFTGIISKHNELCFQL